MHEFDGDGEERRVVGWNRVSRWLCGDGGTCVCVMVMMVVVLLHHDRLDFGQPDKILLCVCVFVYVCVCICVCVCVCVCACGVSVSR